MRNARLAIAFGLVLLLSTPARADALEDVKATETLSQQVADLIAAGKLKAAYARLKPYWPIPAHEVDALIYQAQGQRPTIEARFGRSLSIERAGTQVLGDSFVRYIFLEKYERHAIVWAFTFYRPGDAWVVNSALYTDDFNAMFEWLPGAPGSPEALERQARTPEAGPIRLTRHPHPPSEDGGH